MIYTFGYTNEIEWLEGVPVERLMENDIRWYWVDFECANQEEIKILSDRFHFNALAIEDCVERLERPKVDFYDTYYFFVLHALNPETMKPIELDLFVGSKYIISFHLSELPEINCIRRKISESVLAKEEGCNFIAYLIFDKIVDQYFPLAFQIEDTLNDVDIEINSQKIHDVIDQVFSIRTDLLVLRHTVNSMKELLYRILNSEHLENFRTNKQHFNDIYDHLLKLSDIVEINREVTSDIRDNYLSINSHRMNKIMTTLTIISSIFIPLTFIVGIYGMNFDYMPELRWRYGYFMILGVLAAVIISMVLWFIRKGWINKRK
ncbi:MAG TPA: magnesium/cobalt transporter CorA [Oscillospiraceae bacterium]|nr:magnesium/cobalt transporter CorA [Oscillospiraceae bacterium]HPS34634.1 magnesium/cobalt transporter CorA [Oscillospiraceae bacterium]